MDNFEDQLSNRLEQLLKRNALLPNKRLIVALAGAPGSGKTTIASALMRKFNATHQTQQLQVVPMVCMLFTSVNQKSGLGTLNK